MEFVDTDQRFPLAEPFEGWFQAPPPDGFRWADVGECRPHAMDEGWRGYDGPWLVPCKPVETVRLSQKRWFDVLGDPRRSRFHRSFARLADDRDGIRLRGILRFANRYGWLDPREWDPAGRRVTLLLDNGSPVPATVRGEPLWEWDKAIYEIAALVRLWDLIQKPDEDRIRPLMRRLTVTVAGFCFGYEGNDLVTSPMHDLPGQIVRHVESDDVNGWPPDDVLGPARTLLAASINRGLQGEVDPVVTLEDKVGITYVPSTLRAAIFLHFMHEVSGRRKTRLVCANPRCQRYFEPKHGRQRYCRDGCRQLQWWHDRKDRG